MLFAPATRSAWPARLKPLKNCSSAIEHAARIGWSPSSITYPDLRRVRAVLLYSPERWRPVDITREQAFVCCTLAVLRAQLSTFERVLFETQPQTTVRRLES